MGLDINVYKPIKYESSVESEDFLLLEESPELEFFKDFIVTKLNSYHDLETATKELGHNFNDLEWQGTSYGDMTEYRFHNTKHELYSVYQWLDEIWSKSYNTTLNELFESDLYKEFKSKYLDLLIKYNWQESYKMFLEGPNEYSYNLVSAWEFVTEKIEVIFIDPPIIEKEDRVIFYEEIGYQRKGQNKQFMDDDIWSGPCILKKEVLLDHWTKYFSFDEFCRNEFKTNIIDKFIEGETFVIYH